MILSYSHLGPILAVLAQFSSGVSANFQRADTVRIGAEDGAPEYVFGKIVQVTGDSVGRIYVIDSFFSNLRIFDERGMLSARYGSRGRGPGQFLRPTAVTVAEDKVFVLDPPNARVERFVFTGDSLHRTQSIPVRFSARAMCATDSSLILLGYHNGTNVHEVDLSGKRIRSFGRVHPYRDALMEDVIPGDYLLCTPKVRITGTRILPYIHGYSPSGQELWSIVIPDFERATMGTVRPGVFRYAWPPSGYYDAVVGIVGMASAGVQGALIQVGRIHRSGDIDNIRSFMVDLDSGTLTHARYLGRMAHIFPDGRSVTLLEEPFPAILIHAGARRR